MAHKRPMVSGAKFGLAFVCVFMVFILLLIWQPDPVRQVFRRIPDQVGHLLLFGQPVLIGVAVLITGIQKGRPGIGLLGLLLMPIGFFFALAAENRSAEIDGIVRRTAVERG
ncbi:MAG: hypothetical protein AB9873_09470 [Syntrophobacteraceae bacterium]